MGQEIIRQVRATGAELFNGSAEINRVPEDDGGDRQVEPRGAVALILKGSVPEFAMAMEEQSSSQSVTSLALVETCIGAPAQGRVRDPVQRKQRSFQTTDLA